MMHRRAAYLVWFVVLVMEGYPAAIAILVLLTVLETVTDADNPGVWVVHQPTCLHQGIYQAVHLLPSLLAILPM
jgi:hypothetical protein